MKIKLIEVTPARQQNGEITWTLCHDNSCGTAPKYVDVTLEKDSGQHVFMISLNDDADLGVSFPKNFNDAIWFYEGGKPQQPKKPTSVSSQIAETARTNKSTLVFTNKNKGDPVELHYQLNFVGAPSLDPAIRNGGGTGEAPPPPPPFIGADSVVPLLIGLVVGLAIGALLFRRRTRRQASNSGS